MVKEVILIPKGKCPLVFIRELGEKLKNSWVFLHENVVSNLENTANNYILTGNPLVLGWKATNKLSEISIAISFSGKSLWNEILGVETNKIDFGTPCTDPEYIYFIKMEE